MDTNFEFSEEAEQDLAWAAEFYAEQGSERVQYKFVRMVMEAAHFVALNPSVGLHLGDGLQSWRVQRPTPAVPSAA